LVGAKEALPESWITRADIGSIAGCVSAASPPAGWVVVVCPDAPATHAQATIAVNR
jgi:hypothetical protein